MVFMNSKDIIPATYGFSMEPSPHEQLENIQFISMKNFCLNLTVDQGDWQILGNIRCYMVRTFISIHGIAAKGIWIHQMGLDMARLVWTRGLELLCGPWWRRASSRLWAPRFTGVMHGFCRKMGKEMEKKINANFKFGVAQCHEFVVCCLLFWKKIIENVEHHFRS